MSFVPTIPLSRVVCPTGSAGQDRRHREQYSLSRAAERDLSQCAGSVGAPGASHKWQERTPAMAAGLTDHRWTLLELLRYQVPLPAWVASKRRGRPPKPVQQPAMAVAA